MHAYSSQDDLDVCVFFFFFGKKDSKDRTCFSLGAESIIIGYWYSTKEMYVYFSLQNLTCPRNLRNEANKLLYFQSSHSI